MFSGTFLIALSGYFITEKIVEPQLGTYQESETDAGVNDTRITSHITPAEKKGLLYLV